MEIEALIIRCPCCHRADVRVGGICPKCAVGIPGEFHRGAPKAFPPTQKARGRAKAKVFNQIRVPKEWAR